MNKLSPLHKQILNQVYDIYGREATHPSQTYTYTRFSKRQLRYIMIANKWNKSDAIRNIEDGHYDYSFCGDE